MFPTRGGGGGGKERLESLHGTKRIRPHIAVIKNWLTRKSGSQCPFLIILYLFYSESLCAFLAKQQRGIEQKFKSCMLAMYSAYVFLHLQTQTNRLKTHFTSLGLQ